MGISNQIPNSRLAQPGVCTSTTRPASPFEGQVIYETDTNRVLVYDASAWVMIADTDQPPGMQLVYSQSFSAADPLDVTGVFNSDYTNYKTYLTYYGSVATTVQLQMFSATNTLYTGNNYYRYGWSYTGGGGFASQLAGPGTFLNLAAHQALSNQQTSVEMTFFHPNSSSQRKYIFAEWFDANTGGVQMFHMQVVDNLAFTGFRLDGASGNISGRLTVYGLRD